MGPVTPSLTTPQPPFAIFKSDQSQDRRPGLGFAYNFLDSLLCVVGGRGEVVRTSFGGQIVRVLHLLIPVDNLSMKYCCIYTQPRWQVRKFRSGAGHGWPGTGTGGLGNARMAYGTGALAGCSRLGLSSTLLGPICRDFPCAIPVVQADAGDFVPVQRLLASQFFNSVNVTNSATNILHGWVIPPIGCSCHD